MAYLGLGRRPCGCGCDGRGGGVALHQDGPTAEEQQYAYTSQFHMGEWPPQLPLAQRRTALRSLQLRQGPVFQERILRPGFDGQPSFFLGSLPGEREFVGYHPDMSVALSQNQAELTFYRNQNNWSPVEAAQHAPGPYVALGEPLKITVVLDAFIPISRFLLGKLKTFITDQTGAIVDSHESGWSASGAATANVQFIAPRVPGNYVGICILPSGAGLNFDNLNFFFTVPGPGQAVDPLPTSGGGGCGLLGSIFGCGTGSNFFGELGGVVALAVGGLIVFNLTKK